VVRIADLLAAGPTVSFEFFPPKTEEGERNLAATLDALRPLRPSFVSVTYGAGGSTRDRTHRIVADLAERSPFTPMAHLTCVGHRRGELRTILDRYRSAGLENVLALRGDPPRDQPDLPPGDLGYAVELVQLAREVDGLCVGVAAHPEGHPQAPDIATDRRHLAAKLAVADFAITQFFFRLEDYLDLIEDLDRRGVDRPVIPGIMPVTDVRQIERFAALSGAAFPPELAGRFHRLADDPAAVRSLGVEIATELSEALLAAGAPGLHFYTLNRSPATRQIHARLGLPPADAAALLGAETPAS
jgi:methylenetetrahydrofolate reductase (NADPH)